MSDINQVIDKARTVESLLLFTQQKEFALCYTFDEFKEILNDAIDGCIEEIDGCLEEIKEETDDR